MPKLNTGDVVLVNSDSFPLDMRRLFRNFCGTVLEIVGKRICVENNSGEYWFDSEYLEKIEQ